MKVLGTLRVEGLATRFSLRKCTELVTYLTFHRNGVEADTLMEALWPEQAPDYERLNLPWLYEREVAAIAADTWGPEVQPNEIGVFNPVHIIGLVHMGLALGEIFDHDELARVCDELGQYEFLFVAPVLPISGASGSATGAIAIL